MSKSIISLTRLATLKQETIYLIEQQLKSRRFFDELESIGLGYYEFAPNLDHLILKNIGRDDGSDKTYSWYTKIIDRHCKQVKPDYRSFKKQAALMYKDLVRLNKKKENNPAIISRCFKES